MLDDNGINLIFIITLSAQQRSSLVNVSTLFHQFYTFFILSKTVNTDLIERPKTLFDKLLNKRLLNIYCNCVKLLCKTLHSANSPYASIKYHLYVSICKHGSKAYKERKRPWHWGTEPSAFLSLKSMETRHGQNIHCYCGPATKAEWMFQFIWS